MKVVVCPDSYKGTMTASEAAQAIAEGVRIAIPGAETVVLPVGDGGEGTVDSICAALSHIERVQCETVDPLRRPITASYAVAEGKTALIESAAASGLTLLAPSEHDIMTADTYGTGLLIADAYRLGIRDFIICMGGSATCDGGMGAYQAMKDTVGRGTATFTLLCDVDNPLCGPTGAAAVFGPQKGATKEQIPMLDRRLRGLYGKEIMTARYSGAAGGLVAMLMAHYNAHPVAGISKVLELLDFETYMHDTDLVITGEGRADATTINGKAAKGILDISSRHGVPVVLIAGSVADRDLLLNAGFSAVVQATPTNPDPAIAPRTYLTQATKDMLL